MPTFREYLEGSIDWKTYGFEICCEAKDGREALERYEEYSPDIVITDITMPYIDGLELAERLLVMNPEVAIVFITGNSEFEYARRAIKMGACDYLVKPFDKEELLFSLLKLKDNIHKMAELQVDSTEYEAQKKEDILQQLIYKQNITDIEKEWKLLRDNQIEFSGENFLVCTINSTGYVDSNQSEKIINWENVIINMLKDMIEIPGVSEVFRDFEGNIITILNFETKESLEEYRGYEFEDIVDIVKQSLGFNILVGISDKCYGLANIKTAYYQTIKLINGKYGNDVSKVFYYNESDSKDWEKFYSWDVIDNINRKLEALDSKGVMQILDEELQIIEEAQDEKLESIILISLISLNLSFLVKKGRNIKDVFGLAFKPYETLTNTIDFKEKCDFVRECYYKVIEYQKENKDEKSYLVAEKAKKFIQKEFSNPELSIDEISKHMLMNQTYLRKMFKSETNMTLSEYILKCRMKKAKELLEKGEYKVSYISTMVGYNDVGYFSKCFKKYYGISPGTVNINK